ncbi:ORF103 [Betabaculovirus altermyunipunctae]|uniref:ORF103 n=1 Tax=Betabaculovirus altermyunipunctae TaxID=3051996 RepID=A0A1S5YE03_9BBAC|nr:ORF103 [Betabaculovirus altermyunipunctae]AQQ80370.1 ORF103 [Betabaculovirus altermyunipunctae]
MSLVFFDNAHPVAMLTFGATVYYFKLKHLAKALRATSVTNKIPPRYVHSFDVLLELYPDCIYRFHPCTLFIKLEGLKYLSDECCVTQFQKDCLDRFVRRCVKTPHYKRLTSDYTFERCESRKEEEDEEEEEEIDDVEEKEQQQEAKLIRVGTLKMNVQFLVVMSPKKKWYYKASDVVNLINASCSYNLSKHVSDKNLVMWRDLQMYLEDKYRCRLDVPVKWKSNVLLLKQAGLKQLLLARKEHVLYSSMCLSALHYDFEQQQEPYAPLKPSTSRNRRKQLFAEQCDVGKRFNVIDYIKIPNGKIWYKLTQAVKYYKLKHVNVSDYETRRWVELKDDLQSNNIRWKDDTRMIESAELYRLLQQYALITEADKIYFNT